MCTVQQQPDIHNECADCVVIFLAKIYDKWLCGIKIIKS